MTSDKPTSARPFPPSVEDMLRNPISPDEGLAFRGRLAVYDELAKAAQHRQEIHLDAPVDFWIIQRLVLVQDKALLLTELSGL